jgi:DNA invertase Pin-like site-specific DNA recombinase
MIFTDHASGARSDRSGLNDLLDLLKAGDTLTVWRLDRLGRSLSHLAGLLEQFQRRGIALHSLNEAIDTTNPAGRMIFSIMASLATYERELIVDGVRAGMSAARRRNVHCGRPRSLTLAQREHAALLRAQGQSFGEIAALFRVHPSTVYRNIAG